MSIDTHQLILQFVETYNSTTDSAIYPLYAEEVEWEEMPSQKRGGRKEFFDACREAREVMRDMSLTVISIIPGPRSGVLESHWQGTHVTTGQKVEGRVLWFFRFNDQGLIYKETDYAIPLYGPEKLQEMQTSVDVWDA